jgi:mRNA interferase RelE/StbE
MGPRLGIDEYRGTYRVLYRINDTTREIIVLRIDHRRDAYRPR